MKGWLPSLQEILNSPVKQETPSILGRQINVRLTAMGELTQPLL